MFYVFLETVDLKALMWILPFVFLFHEMEEWNILDWYKSTYCPPPSSTKLSCRIWLFIISILGFITTLISYLIPNKTFSACIILIFIVFMTFNGIQHIYWTIAFGKYAPGVIFSSLGIVAGLFITVIIISQHLVWTGYILILYLITIPFLIQTFKAKNTLIKTFLLLHNFTLKIVDFLEK